MLPYHNQTPKEGLTRQQRLAGLIGELTLEGLVSQEKTKLKEFVLKNREFFILDDMEVGKMHIEESHITMLDGQPVRI